MEPGSWLVPTELDHARVVDAHGRMRTARAISLGVIGVAIVIGMPWTPLWTLGLLLVAALPLAAFERRLQRSEHPERVADGDPPSHSPGVGDRGRRDGWAR